MSAGYDLGKYVILYVDDEEQSLKYFERAFGKDFRVRTAPGAEEGRRIVEELGDQMGVLITDQRMPRETGVELLSWMRRQRPNVVRMLTTAYSDLDSAIEAVNSGAIFRYIVKPWDLKDLRGTLRQAMEFHMVQRERDVLLREKLSALQRLIVSDRVRSFAVLATSMASRLRNPLMALKAFLDAAPHQDEDRTPTPLGMRWDDLWDLARRESGRLLELIEEAVTLTSDPGYDFSDRTSAAEVVGAVGERLGGGLALEGDAPLQIDRALVERLIAILASRLQRLHTDGQPVRVVVERVDDVCGAPGTRLRLIAPGGRLANEELASLFSVLAPCEPGEHDPQEMDLLAAFFIAFHHGGNLVIRQAPPEGPGFELLLPDDPREVQQIPLEPDWIERVFTMFED